jgi:uncharacterized protein YerC
MRISKKQLKSEAEKKALARLLAQFRSVETPEDINRFLNSVLTQEEKKVILRRMIIAGMLEEGVKYREIERIMDASGSTVSNVRDFLEKRGYGRNPDRKRIKERYHDSTLDEPPRKVASGYGLRSALANARRRTQYH